MKKISFVMILFSVLMILPLSAASPGQRLYRAVDEEYIRTAELCMLGGVVYPQVTPVTGEGLISTLERIPESAGEDIVAERDALIASLESGDPIYNDDAINLDIDIYGGFDGMIHGDIDNYEYFVPYMDRDPMVAALLDVSFSDCVDLYIEFMEKDRFFPLDEEMDHYTNFLAIMAMEGRQLKFFDNAYITQAYQPFRVGISAGNDWFNFQLGRNRKAFGSGVTGNLTIGDNFSYDDYFRFSFTSDVFSYYLDVSYFDQQTDSLEFDRFRFSGDHQIRAMHRFELSLFDKFTFGFNIGSVFQTDSAFDPRMFIPMMIPHSFNNFSESTKGLPPYDEANNMLSVDGLWTFLPGWMMHFQVAMDQIQVGSRESGNFMPNAFGFLLNFQNISKVGDGILHSYAEAVYTMPYLYMNLKRNSEKEDDFNYNYDWLLGHNITGGNEIQYSGYHYGPDSLVFSLGSEYESSFGFTGGASMTFVMHGNHGIALDSATSDVIEENWKKIDSIYEYTLQPEVGVSYDFQTIDLEVGLDMAFPYKWNYKHVEGEERFIPQAFLYFRYEFL